MDTVGQRIKRIREIRGRTQKELASILGIHSMTMQSYELGYRHPSQEKLENIANALDVDIAFLQPSKLDTPNAILARLLDFVIEYGDITISENDGEILIGLDKKKNPIENKKLKEAFNAHESMTPEEFKKWLLDACSQ